LPLLYFPRFPAPRLGRCRSYFAPDIFRESAFHYTVYEESRKMGVCKCGKTVKETGTQCRRCAALNELGLKAGASAASIKSAYRLQVKAWHPDKYGKDIAQQWAAEEKTIRLNNAYKVLTSSSKKRDLPQSHAHHRHPRLCVTIRHQQRRVPQVARHPVLPSLRTVQGICLSCKQRKALLAVYHLRPLNK